MVVDEESVYKHEHRFGYTESIFSFACGLGFEMLYAIICDVTDRASGEGGYFGDFHITMDSEFLLEYQRRVTLCDFMGTSFYDFERICVR